MATKKKATPKTIEYRGLVLNWDKNRKRYIGNNHNIYLYLPKKDHPNQDQAWGAVVEFVGGGIVSMESTTPQDAIDFALAYAVARLDKRISDLTWEKETLHKIINTDK